MTRGTISPYDFETVVLVTFAAAMGVIAGLAEMSWSLGITLVILFASAMAYVCTRSNLRVALAFIVAIIAVVAIHIITVLAADPRSGFNPADPRGQFSTNNGIRTDADRNPAKMFSPDNNYTIYNDNARVEPDCHACGNITVDGWGTLHDGNGNTIYDHTSMDAVHNAVAAVDHAQGQNADGSSASNPGAGAGGM